MEGGSSKGRHGRPARVPHASHACVSCLLFSDNIQNVVAGKIFLEMFPNENELIRNHIITHSVLKFIYLDLLKDKEQLEINIEKSSKSSFPEYKRAWEIVEEMGYKELIAEFKNHYHRSKEKITTY